MLRRLLRTVAVAAAAGLGLAAIIRDGSSPSHAAPVSVKPETQPSTTASDKAKLLELSATSAFDNGQYAMALPMLRKVAENLKNQKDQLGLVQEEIRICEQAIQGGEGGSVPASVGKIAMQAAGNGATPGTQPVVNMMAKPTVLIPAKPAGGTPVDPQADMSGNRPIPMTAETRVPHPAPKDGQVVELAIKEIGNFEYDPEKGGNIPADVKALSGHRIRTHGFMMPIDQADAITEFALVPSLFNCCTFGSTPQIQHTIIVHCPKGKAVSYFGDEIVVEGTLKVEEKKDDGYVISVFEMEASSVKPDAK